MELQFAGPAKLCCSSYLMKQDVNYLMNQDEKRRALIIKSSNSGTSRGLQKCSKKNLSRILRTEAAIRGIERKVKSDKHTNLWPKAVLEALDDAIRDNRWHSALKVAYFLSCSGFLEYSFLVNDIYKGYWTHGFKRKKTNKLKCKRRHL